MLFAALQSSVSLNCWYASSTIQRRARKYRLHKVSTQYHSSSERPPHFQVCTPSRRSHLHQRSKLPCSNLQQRLVIMTNRFPLPNTPLLQNILKRTQRLLLMLAQMSQMPARVSINARCRRRRFHARGWCGSPGSGGRCGGKIGRHGGYIGSYELSDEEKEFETVWSFM